MRIWVRRGIAVLALRGVRIGLKSSIAIVSMDPASDTYIVSNRPASQPANGNRS
jgi:hypothetical protein